jgi:hypothetical protein
VVWKGGSFLVAEAAPILIDVGGQKQVVVVGGQTINGLDPDTGRILWSHGHETSGDMNNSMPIWGADNLLVVNAAYKQRKPRPSTDSRGQADSRRRDLVFETHACDVRQRHPRGRATSTAPAAISVPHF